ncbi:MAG: hypothetical protein ACXVCV_11395 [Polyangia bacterium]
MAGWSSLTVSDGHFLDEITAALRDAGIEYRLSEPVYAGQPVAYTRFGQRGSDAKAIEVAAESLVSARAMVAEIYDGAEEAARRESGAPAPTAAEHEDERVWRQEIERKRERSARRWVWGLRVVFGAIALVVAVAVVYSLFRRD